MDRVTLDLIGEVSNRKLDYRLQQARGGQIEPALVELAKDWLKAVSQNKDNPRITVLHRDGSGWWLFHIRRLPGVGAHNRPLTGSLVARYPGPVGPEQVPSLLLNFARCCPMKADKLPENMEPPSATPPRPSWDESVARAMLALALGQNAWVKDESTLVAVLNNAATGQGMPPWLTWVAQMEGTPPDCPPGPGLILGPTPLAMPSEVERCFDQTPATLEKLDLGRLANLNLDADTRKLMLLLALDKTHGALPAGLPLEALLWVSRGPNGRTEAAKCVAEADVMPWIQALPEFPGLQILRGLVMRLGLLDTKYGKFIAERLRSWTQNGSCKEDLFDLYSEIFPGATQMMVDLLEPELQTVWQGLSGTGLEQPPNKTHLETLLRKVAKRKGGSPSFGLDGLAWAAQSGHATSKDLFKKALKQKIQPSELVEAMMDGAELPSGTDYSPPTLRPAWSWLRGVNAQHFLQRCGVLGEWWLEGVKVLHRVGALPRENLLGEGVTRRDSRLLTLAKAGPTLLALTSDDEENNTFPIPESDDEWHPAGNELLEQLFESEQLWSRVHPFLTTEKMRWLCDHMVKREAKASLTDRFQRLVKGGALSDASTLALAPLLQEGLTLVQTVRVAQEVKNPLRTKLLDGLLHDRCLLPAKRTWLRAYLLTCGPLPPVPGWTALELTILLPVLDPIEHVLRVILSREEVEEKPEKTLLDRLQRRLGDVQLRLHLVPRPSKEQQERRPSWVQALSGMLGWEQAAAAPARAAKRG